VIRFGKIWKIQKKLWNDMENMEEK
jgi:hypothetical protein